GLRCFSSTLIPLSRIDRMKQKTILIQCLVPLLQVQISIIDFLVTQKIITDINDTGTSSKHRGARMIGCLFCIEMIFISIATSYIYHATDLLRWHEIEKGWISNRNLLKLPTKTTTNNLNLITTTTADDSLIPTYKLFS